MNLPRIPRPLKILAVIYLAYLALVLFIATPLLNVLAPKIYRTQTGRELQLGKIAWLNPFTLTLDARAINTASGDKNPNQLWSLDALTANVSLASLWHGHLVLDELSLQGLDVQVDQTAPGRFNFSDILDYRDKRASAQKEKAKDTQDSRPFAIEINQFNLTAKHLGYRTEHAAQPMNVALTDFGFALKNFSTVPQQSQHTDKSQHADTPSAPTASTSATPVLQGDHIELTLGALTTDFTRQQYPFSTTLHDLKIAIPAFSTTVNSDYTVNLRDNGGGTVQITGTTALAKDSATGNLQIHALNLLPAWQYLADKLAFTAHHALLDGNIKFSIDWHDKLVYRVQDSQLALRDVQLQARVDADTSSAFSALRVDGIAVDSTQPQVTIAHVTLEKPVLHGWNRDTKVSLMDMIYFPSSEEQQPSSPWQVRVDNIDVANGSIYWRANQLDNRHLTIAPLAIHASNLHWPDTAELQFDVKTVIQEDSKKEDINIAVTGQLVPGDVTGKIKGSITHLPLMWGNTFLQKQMRAIITTGSLSTQFALTIDKAQPTLITSDGAIDEFELQASADKRKLAAWKKLEWRQLTLKPSKQRAKIKQIVATQPWVQFRINTDGTNNFQQLMNKPSETSTQKSAITSQPALTQKEKELKPEGAAKPWQFALDNIHIDKATVDFRDASLSSAFRTDITDLSGDIDDLDSSGNHPAKIGLKGTVDGYAPVALTGGMNPFAIKPALDVTLDITNLDLATLTPYSGTYAGYQIDSGRLTIQLAYKLENDRIKGTNHIIVNQMQLGKQVHGSKVMDLPLRFAIYLLTDADGVMDLGVDVTGDVNSPDFSVGSIIWKAFRNLIVKTATSPFRALAQLVGGGDGDNLDRIEFAAGSDHIDVNQTKKLSTLNKALQEKNKLKLSISGHVKPSQDIEALRDNALSQQLITEGGINTNDIQQQSTNWQREVVKLFKKRFPEESTEQLQVMQMNDAMRDNEELASSALQDLAAQRALAVKQVLVTDMGLAAERAFVKPTDLGADKTPGLQATLEVN